MGYSKQLLLQLLIWRQDTEKCHARKIMQGNHERHIAWDSTYTTFSNSCYYDVNKECIYSLFIANSCCCRWYDVIYSLLLSLTAVTKVRLFCTYLAVYFLFCSDLSIYWASKHVVLPVVCSIHFYICCDLHNRKSLTSFTLSATQALTSF